MSSGGIRFLVSDRSSEEPVYCSIINDLGDWRLPSVGASGAPASGTNSRPDSFPSFARLEGATFICRADDWALRTHYWFSSAGTFICSNNLFLVAYLAGAPLDQTGIDEMLFFLSTIGARTLFEGVSRLRPGQRLRYEAAAGPPEISAPVEPAAELMEDGEYGQNYVEAFLEFFRRARDTSPGRNAAVCASSGTDSNTVIACLRWAGFDVASYSFGFPHYYEQQWTARFSASLGIPFTRVPLLSARELEEMLDEAMFATSGLINPYRLHYRALYQAIPQGEAVFEGTLGSQFVKGDMPVGSSFSECHAHVLKTGESPAAAVDRFLGPLPAEIRARVARTVTRDHQSLLMDISTEEGSRALRSFALNHLPGNMFAGPLLMVSDRHRLYLPYLHRPFLRALLRSGAPGFSRTTGLQARLSTAVKMRTQATIVAEADPRIERTVLGKGVSFREARILPEGICELLRRIRMNYNIRLKHRGAYFGQIDNSIPRNMVASLLGRHEAPWGSWDADRASERLLMSAANIVVSERIVSALGAGLQPWEQDDLGSTR